MDALAKIRASRQTSSLVYPAEVSGCILLIDLYAYLTIGSGQRVNYRKVLQLLTSAESSQWITTAKSTKEHTLNVILQIGNDSKFFKQSNDNNFFAYHKNLTKQALSNTLLYKPLHFYLLFFKQAQI